MKFLSGLVALLVCFIHSPNQDGWTKRSCKMAAVLSVLYHKILETMLKTQCFSYQSIIGTTNPSARSNFVAQTVFHSSLCLLIHPTRCNRSNMLRITKISISSWMWLIHENAPLRRNHTWSFRLSFHESLFSSGNNGDDRPRIWSQWDISTWSTYLRWWWHSYSWDSLISLSRN